MSVVENLEKQLVLLNSRLAALSATRTLSSGKKVTIGSIQDIRKIQQQISVIETQIARELIIIEIVFRDKTPIPGQTNTLTVKLRFADAVLLNSWWAANHAINPDPLQNVEKLSENSTTDTSQIRSFGLAKRLIENMLSRVAPPPPVIAPPVVVVPPVVVPPTIIEPPISGFPKFTVIVFSDNTPVKGGQNQTEVRLKPSDAILLNSWWRANHLNNPDPLQNITKVSEISTISESNIISLSAAKQFIENMLAQKLAPPVPDVPPDIIRKDVVSDDMVSQSIGVFTISNNRLQGEILYIAESVFNPFWYGKKIKSVLQFKNADGILLGQKLNDLTFTNTERDERIQINESAFENAVTVEFFVIVSEKDQRAFSKPKIIDVSSDKPSKPDTGKISPGGGGIISKIFGGLAIVTVISLLRSK